MTTPLQGRRSKRQKSLFPGKSSSEQTQPAHPRSLIKKHLQLHRVCVCYTKCKVILFKRIALLGDVKAVTPLALAKVWHYFRDVRVTSVARARKKKRTSFGQNKQYNFYFCYIHGSVYRESNLITVQQDATYSV